MLADFFADTNHLILDSDPSIFNSLINSLGKKCWFTKAAKKAYLYFVRRQNSMKKQSVINYESHNSDNSINDYNEV